MIKSIIKEILIIILLIIAILLALGIVFYEYNPTSKTVPNKVAEYVLPKEMDEELQETIEASETQNIVKTYRVDSADLTGYEKSGEYKKGKINPFSKETIQGSNNTDNTNTDNNNTNSTGNNTNGTGIQGNFLNTVK